jgi:hypothetical protein
MLKIALELIERGFSQERALACVKDAKSRSERDFAIALVNSYPPMEAEWREER